MAIDNFRRRAFLGAPVLLAPFGVMAATRAEEGGSVKSLNDAFLTANPDLARVVQEVEADLTSEELQKVISALREAPSDPPPADAAGGIRTRGGRRVCFTVRKWVLTTIYVAWKANGWAAALASIPVAATGAGVGPAVILAAIGIGYGEGAGALKAYIDRHKTWPRKVCAWVE